ncbi:PLAA family ubiquitin binding PFU [Trinorchestia longiramus]|nr:PLAA family ubiquitin binding PFU [Trinorchestia longiramus]
MAGGSLKLPYNNSDDPYMVAQKFIDTHQLPQDHLDQVAQFIITNSKAAPAAASAQSFDPFTGGSRYVPGAAGTSNGIVGGGDPFTSSSSYSGSTPPSVPSSHYPLTIPLLFEACNAQGITAKFKENNQLVDQKVRLSDKEVEELLGGVFGAETMQTESLAPLEKALQWSPEKVWPSLDLLRLSLRSREVQDRWIAGSKGSSIMALLQAFLQPPSPTNTQLLAIRCLANMAAHEAGSKQLVVDSDATVSAVTQLAPFPNKNLEIAAATLLLNFAVILTRKTDDLSELCQVLSGLCTLLLTCQDAEAQYRALVGVGTVLGKGSSECTQFAVTLDLRPLLDSLSTSSASKVKECAAHLAAALPT